MNELFEVRTQITKLVEQLITIRYQMRGVHASLPASTQESSLDDLDADPDAETEIRVVVGNCINDSLDPLIRDLSELVKREPGHPKAGGEGSEG